MARLFSDVVQEITLYYGDDNSDKSNETLAKELFFKHANNIVAGGNYQPEDVKLLFKHTPGVVMTTACTSTGQDVNNWIAHGSGKEHISKIINLNVNSTYSTTSMKGARVVKMTPAQMSSLGSNKRKLDYYTLCWTQVGSTIYAYKNGTSSIFTAGALAASGAIDVSYLCDISPLYDQGSTDNSAWTDSTDLDKLFTEAFISRIVDAAGKEFVQLMNVQVQQ